MALVFKNKFWLNLKIPGLIISLIFFVLLKTIDFNYYWISLFQFPIESLIVFFALPFFYTIKNGNGFVYKFFTIVSILSYSIYLINLTIVFDFILGGFNKDYWQFSIEESLSKFFLFWFLSIILSFIPFFVIERPFLIIRNKFIKQGV